MVNSGMSFGWQILGLNWVRFLVLLILFWCWRKNWRAWGWGLMILGGLLNLIETLLRGGVSDYWLIPGTNIYNNINDYLIALGVGQLLYFYLWKKKQK